MESITLENGMRFHLVPLSEEEIMPTLKICDECVGENLYTKGDLEEAVCSEDSFYYLLKTDDGETAGYIYYYLTDKESIAAAAKLDTGIFDPVYSDKKKKVGKLQSIGLKEHYRDMGLAVFMTEAMIRELSLKAVEAVFVVCWRPGGYVPLKETLLRCGFSFLAESHRVWYDRKDLICPYCRGRCICDAEIYYMLACEVNSDEN